MAWHIRKGRYPQRAVVRRYVKLAWPWCERHGCLDRSLDQAGDMPFDLPALVAAMSRTGIGGSPRERPPAQQPRAVLNRRPWFAGIRYQVWDAARGTSTRIRP